MNIKEMRPVIFALVMILASAGALQQNAEQLYQAGLYQEEVAGDLTKAIAIYQDVLKRFPGNRAAAAKAQLHLGFCYEKSGLKQAQEAFQKVVENYPDQSEAVKAAQAKLASLQKAQSAKSDKAFRLRLIWSGAGATFGPVSPNGKYVAFRDSGGDLSIRDIESGLEKRLTHKGSQAAAEMVIVGRWSPDAKKIAYGWYNKDNYLDLRLIGVDGSDPRLLFQDKSYIIFPTGWSPDGKFILAMAQKENTEYQMVLVSATDGTVQVLKTSKVPFGSALDVGFSPDGKYIAFDAPQKENAKESDLFLLSCDGKREIRLAEHPANDKFFGWVPHSDILLFGSDRAVSADIWMIRVADGKPLGEPVLIKRDVGSIQPLGITDQGSFFYGTGSFMVDIYEAAVDLDKGAIAAPPKKIIQKFVGPFYYPCWSPDGKSLAYLADRREPGKSSSFFLTIRSGDTGDERSIPIPITANWSMDWSSDGRSLFAAVEHQDDRQGLFRIDPQTGGLTLLAQSEPDSLIKNFAVSPDGKFVCYTTFPWKKKISSIIRRDLTTGQEKEIYSKPAPPDIGFMAISPDSQFLSFATSDGPPIQHVIRILTFADGKTRDILQGKLEIFTPHVWTQGGKSIFFIKRISDAKTEKGELWQVPSAGGEPTKIGLSMESMRNLRLHPDGKRFVYSSGKVAQEVWAMENFLPDERQKK